MIAERKKKTKKLYINFHIYIFKFKLESVNPVHMHSCVACPRVSRTDPGITENIYDVNLELRR